MTIDDAVDDDAADQQRLARDLIEVHGNEASAVARGNASAAALAGQPIVAKSWIRVLSIIQRQQAGSSSASRRVSQGKFKHRGSV